MSSYQAKNIQSRKFVQNLSIKSDDSYDGQICRSAPWLASACSEFNLEWRLSVINLFTAENLWQVIYRVFALVKLHCRSKPGLLLWARQTPYWLVIYKELQRTDLASEHEVPERELGLLSDHNTFLQSAPITRISKLPGIAQRVVSFFSSCVVSNRPWRQRWRFTGVADNKLVRLITAKVLIKITWQIEAIFWSVQNEVLESSLSFTVSKVWPFTCWDDQKCENHDRDIQRSSECHFQQLEFWNWSLWTADWRVKADRFWGPITLEFLSFKRQNWSS